MCTSYLVIAVASAVLNPTRTMKRVGVVGIGAMGRGIAFNLFKSYKDSQSIALTVFDTSTDNISRFIDMTNAACSNHVHIANSISDLAKNSDIICLSLPRYIL